MRLVTVAVAVILVSSFVNGKVYRDNDREVVIDEENGLMWQDKDIPYLSLNRGKIFCSNLQLAGYNDWYLPNIDELKTLVTLSHILKGKIETFSGNGYYWGSSAPLRILDNGYEEYDESDSVKNNVRCVRKLKKYDLFLDNIPNSCSLIKHKIPSKPNVEDFKQRPYEKPEEFEASKKRSLERWKADIHGWQKSCDFTGKIVRYDYDTGALDLGYRMGLKGLPTGIFHTNVPFERAKKFLTYEEGAFKPVVFTAIIGQNEKEEFEIQKLILPKGKKNDLKKEVEQEVKKLKDENVIEGVLVQSLLVEYPQDDIIREIKAGTKISYNKHSKEIVTPNKYAGGILKDAPNFKNTIVLKQNLQEYKKRGGWKVTFTIKANFPVEKVKISPKGYSTQILEFKGKEKDIYKPKMTKGYFIDKDVKSWTVRVDGDGLTKVWECTIDGCIERKKGKL